MHLENIVIDAVDPGRLGRFWQEALGTEQLTDVAEGFETRLHLGEAGFLDLCFPRVPDAAAGAHRLHLDLHPGEDQDAAADRLRALGARDLDHGQGDAPWIVLADPEDNPFCVLEPRPEQEGAGPVASLPLYVADPAAAADFWGPLSGWVPVAASAPAALRHPSLAGPVLELWPQPRPEASRKNRIHLDIRLDPGDDMDQVAREVLARGGAEPAHDWGQLPWRIFTDPAGNEFCVLPVPTSDGDEHA
ncbi:VOC family protein [Brachybacterium hainanense]|uniref:VOC family protein n=1 Tax=Brachybacterium hainanense TaxID=1541174 RepID=A0ABV6REF7_9MICO